MHTHMTFEEISEVLYLTLRNVIDRKISHKQAMTILKLASALSQHITHTDLKNRLELLEQTLKKRT